MFLCAGGVSDAPDAASYDSDSSASFHSTMDVMADMSLLPSSYGLYRAGLEQASQGLVTVRTMRCVCVFMRCVCVRVWCIQVSKVAHNF